MILKKKNGESITAEKLIWIAIGCVGIKWSELDSLTMDELGEVVNSWYEYQDQLSRERWEQTRTTCLYSLAPHSRGGLKPRDVFELSWDKQKNTTPVCAKSTQADFEALRKRWG